MYNILDLFRLRHSIEKDPKEKTSVEKNSEEKFEEIEKFYFGNVIKITCHKEGSLEGRVTDVGTKKLDSFTKDELLLYFLTVLENHNIIVDISIYGRGPLTKTSDFLAFRMFVTEIFLRLKAFNTPTLPEKNIEIE
jgi:hypothetical protein